jgi:Protein of unknown function (DUF2911)
MRKPLLVFIAMLIAVSAYAQAPQPAVKYPRPSQKSSLMQTIGLTDMTITYSRPGVKGRPIWGALVPYDQVWRTGANEATVISFSDDVTINGQALPKGTYSLHSIPGKDSSWTLIFNKVADQWGSYSYDATKDALRVPTKAEKAAATEWLTFEVTSLTTDKATVVVRWENLAVPFTVDTGTTAKTLAAARAAIASAKADDWRTPLGAAQFAFDNELLSDAQTWSDQAVKTSENTRTLWLKARLQQKQGHVADAVRTGEAAIAKAAPADKDLAATIRTTVDTWKK